MKLFSRIFLQILISNSLYFIIIVSVRRTKVSHHGVQCSLPPVVTLTWRITGEILLLLWFLYGSALHSFPQWSLP